MSRNATRITCHVKTYRQARGWSQAQLAEAVGVKRQAIYDIESGRYLPNTAVALKLARCLDVTVETLFSEEMDSTAQPIDLVGEQQPGIRRLLAANLRGKLTGVPMTGKILFNSGLPAADAFLEENGNTATVFCSPDTLDNTVLLFGCDPAFSILGGHVARAFSSARVHCCFASSYAAMQALSSGRAHVGGIHLHNAESEEANVQIARKMLSGMNGKVIGFTQMEEGLMVARGNPHNIETLADMADRDITFVNRECGAALRILLDDQLAREGISIAEIKGYGSEVHTHNQGAQWVAAGLADAALGLHAVAHVFGLDFVPLETVRCDLVIPDDLMDHPTIRTMLDTLQSRALRHDIASVPGYETSPTGNLIDTL
ncbi:MAG: substrate-binding domain-containing protein [Thermodesulfobacteriota bacterium]|nr:substrate-binding domain-containing protein [Thermodesulfobacteriota bacterium]